MDKVNQYSDEAIDILWNNMYRTENELFKSHRQNIYLTDKYINNRKFTLQEIGNFIPSLLHINNVADLKTIYVNDYYENWLK